MNRHSSSCFFLFDPASSPPFITSGIKPILLAAMTSLAWGNSVKAESTDALAYSNATQLAPVVVTGARLEQPLREVVGDVTVITEADIRANNAQSLQDILRTVPAVQISNNGGLGKATSIFLRGANATQTLVLIDGQRMGSATTGTASFQDIPVDQIERIEVLRGSASSLYGADAVGGVIQIFTKAGHATPAPTITAGIGSYNTSILNADYRGAVGNARFAVGAAYRDTGGFNAIANPANAAFNPDRDGYRSTSLNAQLNYAFTSDHEVGLSVLAARVRNRFDQGFPTANFDYYNNDRLSSISASSRDQFQPWWTSNLRLGQSEDDNRNFSPLSSISTDVSESSFTTHQTQFSWQNDVSWAAGVNSIGVEQLQQNIAATTSYALKNRTINSAFTGYLARLNNATLQANVRNDHNPQYGSKTTAYGGLSYDLNSVWQTGGSIGTGFRAPSFNELYFPGFGNANLRPERARNEELFTRYAADGLRGGLTFFRNEVRDLIVNTGPNFTPVNVGQAQLRGATLNIDWLGDSAKLGGNINWLSAKDSSGGSNNGKFLPRRARQDATFYVGSKWNSWDWRAQVITQGRRFDDAGNTQTLGGYSMVNLVGGWKFAREWSARLSLENAFGKRYELARDYDVARDTLLLTLTYQPAP